MSELEQTKPNASSTEIVEEGCEHAGAAREKRANSLHRVKTKFKKKKK